MSTVGTTPRLRRPIATLYIRIYNYTSRSNIIIIIAFQYRNNTYKDNNWKDDGVYLYRAREPAATKEKERIIKRSLHKIIKLHFDRTVKGWTKV